MPPRPPTVQLTTKRSSIISCLMVILLVARRAAPNLQFHVAQLTSRLQLARYKKCNSSPGATLGGSCPTSRAEMESVRPARQRLSQHDMPPYDETSSANARAVARANLPSEREAHCGHGTDHSVAASSMRRGVSFPPSRLSMRPSVVPKDPRRVVIRHIVSAAARRRPQICIAKF